MIHAFEDALCLKKCLMWLGVMGSKAKQEELVTQHYWLVSTSIFGMALDPLGGSELCVASLSSLAE